MKYLILLITATFLLVNCQTSDCTNGQQDGNETGVDCGGDCTPCSPGKIIRITENEIGGPQGVWTYDFVYVNSVLDSVICTNVNNQATYVYKIQNDKIFRLYGLLNPTVDEYYYYTNDRLDSIINPGSGPNTYYTYDGDTIIITNTQSQFKTKYLSLSTTEYMVLDGAQSIITLTQNSNFPYFNLWSGLELVFPFDVIGWQNASVNTIFNIEYDQFGNIQKVTGHNALNGVDLTEWLFEYM